MMPLFLLEIKYEVRLVTQIKEKGGAYPRLIIKCTKNMRYIVRLILERFFYYWNRVAYNLRRAIQSLRKKKAQYKVGSRNVHVTLFFGMRLPHHIELDQEIRLTRPGPKLCRPNTILGQTSPILNHFGPCRTRSEVEISRP